MSADYAKIFAEFTQPQAPGAVLRRISDIPAQELRWLWPGRIPLGKLTLFAGDPGLGKSFVTLDIAAHATLAKKWPDGEQNSVEPGSVVILSAEDDPADTIRPRLEAAGADLRKVHILQAVRRNKPNGESRLEQFSLETDLVALQDAISSLGDVRLIVIDPISAYLGDTDSHVNAKVRSLLSPLAELASGLHVAALAVTHLNKNTSSAMYRATGSIAFVAAARAVWLFAKDPDDPSQRLMLPGKMNLAPDQEGLSYTLKVQRAGVVAVVWGATVRLSADAVLQPEAVEEKTERLEAMGWLRERLSEGPVSQREIKRDATAAGMAWRTVRRAKDSLGMTSEKEGFKGGWRWQLPVQEGVRQLSKVSSPETWTPSAKVDTFEVNGPPNGHGSTTINRQGNPTEYISDAEGPGCTCRSCGGHFGTAAGWRAHISRRRCASYLDVSREEGVQ